MASNARKDEKRRTPLVASAHLVLKGAVQNVLGTSLLLSKNFVDDVSGKLGVEYDIATNGEPAPEVLKKIEAEAEKIVKQNVPIQALTLPRAEAESRFKDVNGQFIYDKDVPDAAKQELQIVVIDGWAVNSADGAHMGKTGELPAIHISGVKCRAAKKEMLLSFYVGDAPPPSLEAKGKEKAKGKNKGAKESTSTSAAPVVQLTANSLSEEMFDSFFAALEAECGSDKALCESLTAKKEAMRADYLPKMRNRLYTFRNMNYSNGFAAADVRTPHARDFLLPH